MLQKSAYIWVPKNGKTDPKLQKEIKKAKLVRENELGKLYKRNEYQAKTFIDNILEKVLFGNVPFGEAVSKVL